MPTQFDPAFFGRRVRDARVARRLTQAVLAEKIGVGNNYISMLERGKKQPSFDTFLRLVLALEMPGDYFIMDYTPYGVIERNAQINGEIEKLDLRYQQMLLDVMEVVTAGLGRT